MRHTGIISILIIMHYFIARFFVCINQNIENSNRANDQQRLQKKNNCANFVIHIDTYTHLHDSHPSNVRLTDHYNMCRASDPPSLPASYNFTRCFKQQTEYNALISVQEKKHENRIKS